MLSLSKFKLVKRPHTENFNGTLKADNQNDKSSVTAASEVPVDR
jgi:hypothetical protein